MTNTELYFYIGHAAALLGVSKKTINRWSYSGKISFTRRVGGSKGWKAYALSEINKVRQERGQGALSRQKAEYLAENTDLPLH